MAESVKNEEKLSMTSDLGSSCCDNDHDVSCDIKDNCDDVNSVAGSTSLTIDSLEEEEQKEQSHLQTSTAATEQSATQSSSDSKEKSASDSSKNHCIASSEGVMHSENGRGEKHSEKTIKDDNSPEADTSENKQENKNYNQPESQQTTTKCQQTTTNRQTSDVLHKDTQTISKEAPPSTDSSSTSSKSEKPDDLSDIQENKLVIRKCQSLTDESSTDPSPKLPRRSGIPRRKNSTHSMTTVLSLGSNTPQHSPGRIRRSFTVDSAGDFDLLPAGSMWNFHSPMGITPRSFPSSPVRVPRKLRSSASQCDCCSVSGVSCPPLSLSRDNVASRMRFEKSHRHHEQVELPYLTPSQRRDLALKELRVQLKELGKQLEAKDKELQELTLFVEEEKRQIQNELQDEVEDARAAAEAARKEVVALQESHIESVKTVATLRQQLDDVKKDMRSKLAESEDIFLEMYNKGRQSAIFEHEEEMELRRKGGRSQEATEKELYNKLVRTQAELAKWQTIQRHESYHTMPVPGTEAESTLRFLKDSVFHFLTTDKNASDEHLRAIVRILHFSDVQREKIAQAIIMKRNKTGW